MNEKDITLPVCGGRAWLRTRLTDAQMGDYEDCRTRRLPPAALAAMAKAWRDGTLDREAPPEDDTNFLMAEGFTGPELRAAAKAADRDVVRIVCKRWSDVRGPESDDLLAFPDGLPDMYPEDFSALLLACYQAVSDGRADPNDGEGPSRPTSSVQDDTAATNSHATSETLSDSTLRVVAASA